MLEYPNLERTQRRIASALEKIATHSGAGICYGFSINPNESDPAAAVTYLEDAVGMTPAHMDFNTGIFDYGSWGDAFFMPRPCMLRNDGTVAYYLNPNNYALKDDGTASDVANTNFDGNAMMEWGRDGNRIYYKVVPNSNGATGGKVYIANYQRDSGFKCYSFYGKNNRLNDHFYTPIYNGSKVNNKLRSLSGQVPCHSESGTSEMTMAQANGEGWNIEEVADRMLINFLLVLMGKSLNTQAVYGQGYSSGGGDGLWHNTGTLDNKGLFYGSSAVSVNVKVFGMENYWGEVFRRTNGMINAAGTLKVKMTPSTADGSTATSFNTDASGYISIGASPAGHGNIKDHVFTETGIWLKNAGGSASTYYCDYVWVNNSATCFALFGGSSHNGSDCGAFCVNLSTSVGIANWRYGAALSFRNS